MKGKVGGGGAVMVFSKVFRRLSTRCCPVSRATRAAQVHPFALAKKTRTKETGKTLTWYFSKTYQYNIKLFKLNEALMGNTTLRVFNVLYFWPVWIGTFDHTTYSFPKFKIQGII